MPASRRAVVESSPLSSVPEQGHAYVHYVRRIGVSMNREEVFRSLIKGSFNEFLN